MGRALVSLFSAAGLAVILCGCTTTVSDSNPPPAHNSPGRGYKWGHERPTLVVIEGTRIQYARDCDEDIYLLDGVWYRYSGGWYCCASLGGAWVTIGAPPAEFQRIPPGHAKFHKAGGPGKGPEPKGPPPGHDPDHGKGNGPKKKYGRPFSRGRKATHDYHQAVVRTVGSGDHGASPARACGLRQPRPQPRA